LSDKLITTFTSTKAQRSSLFIYVNVTQKYKTKKKYKYIGSKNEQQPHENTTSDYMVSAYI